MAKKKESQEGLGDKGDQDGQGDGSKAGDGDDGTKTGDGEGEGGEKKTEPQYVTPTALQGVIDANKRTQAEAQKKSDDKIEALATTIGELTKSLAGKSSDGDGDGEGDGSSKKKKVDPQIAELTRRLEQTETALASEKTSRAAAEEKEENNQFEHTVKQALNDADCEKVNEAFLVIKPRLKRKDDGTPFATVTIDGGLETDVDLKTYIKRYFSEEVLPHVFKGKMRSGSPASGEEGESGGSQGYDYTWEQVQDPEFYAKNADKLRKAIELGRVKGMPAKAV